MMSGTEKCLVGLAVGLIGLVVVLLWMVYQAEQHKGTCESAGLIYYKTDLNSRYHCIIPGGIVSFKE